MIPAFIPGWLVRALFSLAVNWALKRFGFDATVAHFDATVEKATPLLPDPNPSPKDRQGPIEKHYGG